MAQTDSTKEMVDKTTSLGWKNRDLLPSVRNWCALLDLADQSVGMIHDLSGLPTHFQLSCRHAALARSGMDLSLLAQGFIQDHCRNCPHHKPLSEENFGKRLLEDLIKEEVAAKELDEAKQKAQQALQKKIAELVAETKKKATPPALSILRLIESLQASSEGKQTAEKLLEASVIQPSFFIAEALDAMAIHYSNPEWGNLLLQTTAQVLTKGGKLSPFALDRCHAALTIGVHPEEAANVAALVTDYSSLDPWIGWVEYTITSLNYLQVFGYNDRTGSPKAEREAYIARCVRADEEKMKAVLSRHLLSPEKIARVNATRLLKQLFADNPRFGILMLPVLIQALELPEDRYLESADHAITEVIAAIIIQNDAEALEQFHSLTEEIKTPAAALSVTDVYRYLLEDDLFMDRNPGLAGELSAELPATVIDRSVPFELREKALDILSALARSGKASNNMFSMSVGCLSQLNDEKQMHRWRVQQLKEGNATTFNPLAGMNVWDIEAIEMQLNRFRETLITLIAEQLEKDPESNYQPFIEVLTGPSNIAVPGLKTDLLAVAMKGVDSPRYIARYIPHLYTQLFDTMELQNRLQALYFLRKMIEHHPQVVTETLLGVVDAFSEDPEIAVRAEICTIVGYIAQSSKINLTEQHIAYIEMAFRQKYVYIQRRAILSARNVFPFMSGPRVEQLALNLVNIAVNAGDPQHKDFEEHALSVLIDISLVHTRFLPVVVHKLIVPLCSIHKDNIDRKYVEVLKRIQTKHPEYTDVWIKALANYLGTSNPERYNAAFDRRNQHYADLFESPYTLIVRHKTELIAAAESVTARNPWDGFNFIYLFCEFELYDEAVSLCTRIQNSVGDTRSNEQLLSAVKIMKTFAEEITTPGSPQKDWYKDIKNELQKIHT